MKGEYVQKNYDTAAEWYKKAANQGDPEAKKILKHLIKSGLVYNDKISN